MAVGFAPANGAAAQSRVPTGDGPVGVRARRQADRRERLRRSGVRLGRARAATTARRSAAARSVPQARAQRGHVRGVPAVVRERGIPAASRTSARAASPARPANWRRPAGAARAIELDRAHRVARALPPEVLLCAETQERYCWVVADRVRARSCARSTSGRSRSATCIPAPARARDRRGARRSGGLPGHVAGRDAGRLRGRGDHHRAARRSARRAGDRRRHPAKRAAGGRPDARRRFSVCSAAPQLALARVSVPPLRQRSAGADLDASGRGRCRGAARASGAADRSGVRGRRQPVLVRGGSRTRRAARGRRGRAQRRVRRGAAVGAHRLPQLRTTRGAAR